MKPRPGHREFALGIANEARPICSAKVIRLDVGSYSRSFRFER